MRFIAVGAIATAIAIGAILSGGGGGTPTLANMWVQSGGGTCARSSTTRDLASSGTSPDSICGTWDAANDVCAGGDQVLVMGAAYGAIQLTGSNARTSMCTFTVATSQTVTSTSFDNGVINNGDTGADWVTIVGPLTTNEFDSDQTTHDVFDGFTMDGLYAICQCWHVEGSSFITVQNTEIKDALAHTGTGAMTYLSGDNFSFIHDTFHGAVLNHGVTVDDGTHTECMFATSVTNMTISRSFFYDCSTEDIFITGSAVATNWTVENNVLEKPTGPNDNALAFRSGGAPTPSPDGFVLRYNTIDSGIQMGDNGPTANGFTVTANYVQVGPPCALANTTYSYNVTPTGTANCGGVGAASFLAATINAGFTSEVRTNSENAAPGDYHVNGSSPLDSIGQTSGYPATDLAGTVRTGTTDIGAYIH